MTNATFAIEIDGDIPVEIWIDGQFLRVDNGPDDSCDWKLVKATCFRMVVSPHNAGHEFVDMTERYEDGGADYTEWLRNEISADRRKDPSVYKLTELRHMTRPTFIKDTAPMGLSSLLDWVHERETEPDKGGEADRVLDTMKTVGSFG